MNTQSTYYPENKLLQASCHNIMGTRLDAIILDVDRVDGEAVWAQCVDYVNDLEQAFSRFLPDSETSRINAAEPLSLMPVSPLYRDILDRAVAYRQATLGAFDITLGMNTPIQFDVSGCLIIGNNGLHIDLGGIAKGYALQGITTRLKEAGISNAFVNFGGSSIMALGHHPAGESWPVTVSDPFTRRQLHTFYLRDSSLSTSGNTPHYNGHIINPFTSRAVTGDHLSAVVSTSAIDAEVLSTAWIVVDADTRRLILNNFSSIIDDFRYN